MGTLWLAGWPFWRRYYGYFWYVAWLHGAWQPDPAQLVVSDWTPAALYTADGRRILAC